MRIGSKLQILENTSSKILPSQLFSSSSGETCTLLHHHHHYSSNSSSSRHYYNPPTAAHRNPAAAAAAPHQTYPHSQASSTLAAETVFSHISSSQKATRVQVSMRVNAKLGQFFPRKFNHNFTNRFSFRESFKLFTSSSSSK